MPSPSVSQSSHSPSPEREPLRQAEQHIDPSKESLTRSAVGRSLAANLRDAILDSSVTALRTAPKQIAVAERTVELIDSVAQLNAQDYRKVVGLIANVRQSQHDRNKLIKDPAVDSNLPEGATVHNKIREVLAKWELKHMGVIPPSHIEVASDAHAKVLDLTHQLYVLCYGDPRAAGLGKPDPSGKNIILPDEDFIVDILTLVRLAYPGGINVFNPSGHSKRPSSYPIESEFWIQVASSTIHIKPGGHANFPGDPETGVKAQELTLEDGVSCIFGRALGLRSHLLDRNLTLKRLEFRPDALTLDASASRFAIEFLRLGDQLYIFDRASRNNISFTVSHPIEKKVTGEYVSGLNHADNGGGEIFGGTNIRRLE